MESIVEQQSSSLRVSDLIENAIRQHSTNVSTDVGRLVSDAAVRVVGRHVDPNPAKPLNVSFSLTPDEQNIIRRDFPGVELQFKNTAQSSHSFAAAHRVCETDYIYNRFQTSNTTIIDIGGNFCTHAKMGRENVHSCCPILDVRDGARYTDRFLSIAGALERQPERELRMNYCSHTFQECDVAAPWAMAIHSISDIPITTVVKHCFRRGVKKLIASVMMDPMMLVTTSGHIPHLNVVWEVETTEKGKDISFHFLDAPGLSYTHSYDTLMQYMSCNQVIVEGKAAYRVERVANLSGVFIVEITLACSDMVNRLDLVPMRDVSCAWLSSLRKKTMVRVAVPQLKNSWEIKYVILDTDFVRRVAEVSFRQYKPNTPLTDLVQHVATMISSASNHCIINGITMQAGSPVDVDLYVPLAVTFVAYAKSRHLSVQEGFKMVKNRGGNFFDPSASTDYCVEKGELVGQRNRVKLAVKSLFFPVSVKTDDNSTLLYNQPILQHVVDEIKSLFGWDIWSTDDAVVQRLPSFYKMDEVYSVVSDHYCLSHTLNVDYWLEGLMDDYDATRRAHNKKLAEEEAHKAKVEKALVKIAEVLESDNAPTGLLPLKAEPLVHQLLEKKTDEIITRPQCSDASKPHINPYADAIKEVIAYHKELDTVNHRNLNGVGNFLNWTTRKSYSSVWGADESRCVYEPLRRKWFNKPPGVIFEKGMSIDGFVSLAWEGDDLTEITAKALSKYNVIVCDKSCVFDAGSRLIPALEKSLTMDCKVKISIEDGVAGCGKTTSLLKQAKIESDLLLSANRETAADARRTIPEIMHYRVRTLDSYLMLKKWFTADRLLVDECFLVHAGIIYAAATLGQVKEIIAFGDTKQIPFVSRIPTFPLKHPRIIGVLKPKTVTYRCPRDATALLSEKFYKTKVTTANPISTSLSLVNINSAFEIPAEKDVLYITHTVADKATLQRHFGIHKDQVLTTHEAQGKTYDHVILVRLSKTGNLLYSGKNPETKDSHNLVALSRHKKTLRYYSVFAEDPDDQVATGIKWVKTLDTTSLSRYRLAA
ncbi:MAG: replicase polyprotein (methyl transferase, helicase) [Tomato ilarvirus 1]|uniref:Replication protein 1a n=1 Tax=Tomato ilarvirus 1 TaxID=2950890 RepID=A0AAX3BP65_9BROM|nr:MAG: replicase polyprotein (methyl transferase, helicase) [Tomato ilarvirus 1]